MFQKKFKQFLAATLSAAMVIGQVQYVQAAENEGDVVDLTEDFEIAPAEDAPELELEDIEKYIDSDEELQLIEAEPIVDSEEPSEEVDEVFDEESADDIELFDEEASTDESFADEADLEEVADEAVDVVLPEGVVGMAEDYELTESELAVKEDAIANEDTYFNDFASLVEGKDYAKDEVVFLADSKEHAEEVAAAYAGVVKSFDNGVAVIDLSESQVSVEAAYSCAFIEGVNLPVVTPNYFFSNEEVKAVDEEYLGSQKVEAAEEAVEETAEETAEETPDVYSEEAAVEPGDEFDTAVLESKENGTATATTEAVYVEEEAAAEVGETAEAEAVEETEKLFNEPYLDATVDEYQWQHNMIDSYSAWMDLGKDGLSKTSEVIVAVIDDGIADVEELNLANEAGYNGSHGTQVAGVIGAQLNENGGAGVAPGVQLLNLKSDFTAASVMVQLRTAVAEGADVINMSFEGAYIDPQFASVVDEVYAAGVTMVAAAGNGVSYPAACENVIAVVSVNEAGKVSSFVADASVADIAAPGSNIWTTDVDGSYVMVSGSAYAASVVSGAAALYMTKYGQADPSAMKAILLNTADVKDEISVVNVRSLLGATSVLNADGVNATAVGNKTKKITFAYNGTVIKKYTMGTVASGAIKTKLTFTASTDNGASVIWTCPKGGMNKVDIRQSGNSVTVTTRGKTGTVRLKCQAPGKTSYLSVKVINPVSGNLSYEYPTDQFLNALANGGSFKIKKAKAEGAAGLKPTKKTIKWLAIVRANGTVLSEKDAKKVATAVGGKVTAKRNAFTWLKNHGYTSAVIYPVAYSTDGTGYVWTFTNFNSGNSWAMNLTWRPKTPFGFGPGGGSYSVSRNAGTIVPYSFTHEVRRGFLTISRTVTYIDCYTPFYAYSDNPNVLKATSVAATTDSKGTVYRLKLETTGRTGTVHITVRTMDGTKLKSTGTFVVR